MKVFYTLIIFLLLLSSNIVRGQAQQAQGKSVKSFALLVHDYDEAIEFYTKKLGFNLLSDQEYGENMRWVSLGLGESEIQITLGKAAEEEKQFVGKQAGLNYPFFVIVVKDVDKVYDEIKSKGVNFTQKPTQRPWGLGAVFEDLYGNKIYLQEE